MLRRLDRIDASLFALIGLAIATLWAPAAVPNTLAGNAVLFVIAISKGRRIALHYLGLRDAPAVWRRLVTAWVVLLAVVGWGTAAISLLR